MFPPNVIESIVNYASPEDKLKLALVNDYYRHMVYCSMYKKILIVDSIAEIETCPRDFTMLEADNLLRFAASLTPQTFHYIKEIAVSTRSGSNPMAVLELFGKISNLWSVCSHRLSFLIYDVVTLRATSSIDNYLEHNLLSLTDCEDEVLTRRNRKMVNLRNWLMADMTQFVCAPLNPALGQLSFYVESTFHQDRFHSCEMPEQLNYSVPRQNLATINTLFLHTPLSFMKFIEMVDQINALQLKLKKVSLTCSHRIANDARLDFHRIMTRIDLNHVAELELRINCIRRHECQNSCLIRFFHEWRLYNSEHDIQSKVEKLAIVHHKSAGDQSQFKEILENHIFSPLFPQLTELLVNCSNTTRSGRDNVVNMSKVIKKLHHVPELRRIHLSSFFCEWAAGVPGVFQNETHSYFHVLTNRCSCQSCNTRRGMFTKLAELDKCNNYNHKLKLGDLSRPLTPESWIDYGIEANVKFFQYLGAEFRKEEAIMEQNLASTGTMLDMEHVPTLKLPQVQVFKELFVHSCLQDIYREMKNVLVNLQEINFGGISVGSE